MSKSSTQIEIELLDGQVVGAVSRINLGLESVEKKAQSVGENHGFEKFASGVKEFIEDPLQGVHGTIDGLLSKLGGIGGAGVGLAGAVSVFAAIGAAGYESMEKLAALGRETENVSLRMGLSTKEVGEFTFAAKAAGGDVGTLEHMMRGLTMAVEGTDAKSQAARETLRGFGVDIAALKDGTASTSDTLLKVSRGLEEMPNVFERNKVALDLFKRSGIEAIPVLMELEKNVTWAREHGLGLNDEELAKFNLYHRQLTEIGAEWDVLKRKMMEPIAGFISIIVGRGDTSSDFNYGGKQWELDDSGDWGPLGPKLHWMPAGGGFTGLQTVDQLKKSGGAARIGVAPVGIQFAGNAQQERDRASYFNTLPGAEEHLRDAQKSAKAAWDDYNDSANPTDALRDAWLKAAAAVKTYGAQVESLRKKTPKSKYDLRAPFDTEDAGTSGTAEEIIANMPDWQRMFPYDDLSHGIGMPDAGNIPNDVGGSEIAAKFTTQTQAREKAEADAADDAARRAADAANRLQDLQDQAAQKEAETFAHLFTSFTNAAQYGGHRGITSYFRQQGHSLEDTVIGNVAQQEIWPMVQGAIPHFSGALGNLLQGTPFGPKASDPLKAATDSNTAATIANTKALIAMATGARGGAGGGAAAAAAAAGLDDGSLSMPDGGGAVGGIYNPFGGTLSGASDLSDSAFGLSGWGAHSASASGSPISGLASIMSKVKGFGGDFASGAADPIGMLFGGSDNYTGTLTFAQGLGAGTALAAAGFAAYTGIAQIVKGGAHNALGGIGTLTGTAAALDPDPLSKSILGAVAIGSGLLSMILGNPQTQRQNQINAFLTDNAYAGPTPVSYTRDMNGQTMGTDFMGNSRQTGGNTSITIQAMDSESFNGFLQKNPSALDNGMYSVFQNGNKTAPQLRQIMLGGS